MKTLLKNLAAVAILGATSVLLIADAANECEHPSADITYDVSDNTCGEPGTLRVQAGKNDCDFSAEVAPELGIPASGDAFHVSDLRTGGWVLSGPRTLAVAPDGGYEPPTDGGTGTQDVTRFCEALRNSAGGPLQLGCTDHPEKDRGSPTLYECGALLTPR